MSESERYNRVAPLSVDNKAIREGIVNRTLLETDFVERGTMVEEVQEVLRRVAQYTEPASMVQRVYNHQANIIALQADITPLKEEAIVPPECDHTEMECRIHNLMNKLDEPTRRPVVHETDMEHHEE